MAEFAAARAKLETVIKEGPGEVPATARAAAFDAPATLPGARGRYAGQVALAATGVTDEDVAALRAEGLGDVEIFEYTVAAAVGQAGRQLDAALVALRGGKAS